ncbi:MAG: phosphoserine aminotransferase [Micavibrio sp.]|nr:MAG: phosphoserine aminotransferase [Micavibrio sp.]
MEKPAPKPKSKPNNPCFSSGPCAKRPGWSCDALSGAMTGRSHRAGPAKAKLKEAIEKQRKILGIPENYKIGIVPASDTGAFEMALWSLLGEREVDVLAWESFSSGWASDIKSQLSLDDVNYHTAEYGSLPDLNEVSGDNDTVFVWNGTTSGVRVPDGDWIDDGRAGLTLCDATSAVFAYDLPWEKLDVTTWSWQKVLGGEGAHGMIVLSPRAVERLESYTPPWPLPKIFRLTKKGKLIDGIFVGETINTPSMLAVEDCLDALNWVESIGGLKETIARSANSFAAIENWVSKTDWIDFLAETPATRSTTSVCLKISDPWFADQMQENQMSFIGDMCKTLDKEGAAFDIKGYRDAPPGLRIWCGATVETSDVEALLPWVEYAYATTKEQQQKQAA